MSRSDLAISAFQFSILFTSGVILVLDGELWGIPALTVGFLGLIGAWLGRDKETDYSE